MIVVIYRSEELGDIKMTVGVKKFTHEKIEYSITVPAPHTQFLEDNLKINIKSKKRKSVLSRTLKSALRKSCFTPEKEWCFTSQGL